MTTDWELKLMLVEIGINVFVIGIIKRYAAAVA